MSRRTAWRCHMREPWRGTDRPPRGVLTKSSDTSVRRSSSAQPPAGPARGARRRAHDRRGTPLQPPPDHPRRRDVRAEAAQERQGPRHRRRRPGQPRAALPGRGRRRHPRHRRVRRGGRVQPAAPGHPRAVRHREVEGTVGRRVDRRDQPLRQRRDPRGAARQRQRDAGLRGLRPDRRRHRQLRDPLHGRTTRRTSSGSPTSGARSTASTARPRSSRRRSPRTRPATGASTPSPRRRAWSRAAPRVACSACCAPRSGRSRSTRRSS